MFSLAHDPLLQYFGGVPVLYLDRLLHDYLSAVGDLVHEMHRCARDLDAVCESRFMDASVRKIRRRRTTV